MKQKWKVMIIGKISTLMMSFCMYKQTFAPSCTKTIVGKIFRTVDTM